MGRLLRTHVPNSLHHVMGKGNGGQEIFGNAQENLLFLGILEDVLRKTSARLLSYCLMVNHFHLMVQTAEITLSKIMQRVGTRYAKAFNRYRRRLGHVFQGRFKSKIILKQAYLLNVTRYIAQNPVEAGLVDQLEDWPWNSHAQVVGPIHSSLLSRDALLAKFASNRRSALRRYKNLMASPNPDFEPVYDEEEELPAPSPGKISAASLASIASSLISSSGIDFTMLPGRSRRPAVSNARKQFCIQAAAFGFGVCEIAAFLGISPSAAHFHINS